ncbi:MAG: S1 RNA-binding domain-containing protein [Patescibacteria group bacterium]|nr:S1 RNA-binding domain-containing protein [Patescibacteria group bacterium]MDP4031081.1 S1 RNA-binding domain-containing protein [Candidatus Beckwithbacteria bacterium]MDZ4229331.1 S1 RNA-binding domain-containing protein [Patescibacteria group bacterium]
MEKKPTKVKPSKLKKTPVTPVKKASAPQTMDALLKKTGYALRGLKRGQKVQGVVTDINKRMVLIDIGSKTEGIVTDKELELSREMMSGLKVGDKIEAYIQNPENERGQILLSLKQTLLNKRWEYFDELIKSGEVVRVKGLEVNKGGIIVKVAGVRGFVPASQFGRVYLGRLEELQNKSFEVKVIEVNRNNNRLIFSEKAVSEQAALAHQAEALKKVKPGDSLSGVVSGIMPFGIFVRADISNGPKTKDMFLEGLVHISEISWEKVDNPANHYKVGDQVKVKVIGVDVKSTRLHLSVKQLLTDPWLELVKKYPEGKKVKGEITRLAGFGAFVNLSSGVDGLIHISKIPSDKEFKVGDAIECFVEKVDAEHRRISLSLALIKKPVGYK